MKTPESLLEATRLFSNPRAAHDYLAKLRWPDGVIPCPRCGSNEDHLFLENQLRWKCRHCKMQFSVKVGTIFEDSPLGLDKWLIATWLIVNAKNGISSCEIARSLEVTQKTAWFVLHRIRLALQEGTFEKFGGSGSEVEVDETYIGAKARNMHFDKKPGYRGMVGKQIVMGFLERGGKVRTIHISQTNRKAMEAAVNDHVEHGTDLYTDAHGSYRFMSQWYKHQVIDHAQSYVQDRVHTNGLENYWSLLKRAIGGTYVSVEPFHLHRYMDEQAFRYNERKGSDADRFLLALLGTPGRRLTFAELTGKLLPAAGA